MININNAFNNITWIHVLIIIIVMTLIYTVCYSETDASKRKAAHNLLSKSSGLNDKKSRHAKKKTESIKNKTSKDEFLKARVEHLNEHNDQHITEDVIQGYTNTLQRLVQEDPNEIITAGDENNNIPERDFITEAIENFVQTIEQRAFTRVIHPLDINNQYNQYNQYHQYHPDDFMGDEHIAVLFPTDDGRIIPINNFLNFAETALPAVRHRTIQERKKEANVVSKNKEEAIQHFLKDSETHTNDPQNAHDVQVNSDVKRTFDTIAGDKVPFSVAYDAARNYITNNSNISNEIKEKASKTLDYINTHNRNISILGGNGTEKEVFARVWGRTSARGNETNRNLMRDAVINALADAVENNSVVCPNGTTSRLLESPVLLDKDPKVGNINTFENLKNMIMEKGSMVVRREIENAKQSDNEKLFAVGMSYEDPKIDVDLATLDMFEENLKEKLDDMLGHEAKEHNIEEHNINILREQLHAAVV